MSIPVNDCPNQHEAANAVNTPALILQANGLCKTYPMAGAELMVLRDVSFSMRTGDTCAILGPSGSGKTTLLGLCAGLDRASSGSVVLDGKDLGALDEDARAELRNTLIGFIFQSFQLIATLTALENVMVPLELRGGNHPAEQAVTLLQKVGLGERLRHYPAQLSAGEQQRVALARAFIHRPRILFADEPTGNLDDETGHKVIDLMFELNEAAGTALVLVTHDLELAQRTRRIIRLRGGRVIDDSFKATHGD